MKPNSTLKILAFTLSLALAGVAENAPAAATLNTGSLVAGAASALPACLRFRLVGVCLWLVCAGPYCKVETSIKYGHYNPDVVVNASNGLGKNPWAEANLVYSAIDAGGASAVVSAMGGSLLAGVGGIETGSNSAASKEQGYGRKSNLSYREAQAIGHPLAGQFYCPSAATYLNAYYLSGLDSVGWRWQLPEVVYPQALIPGLREIGSFPLNTWGSVYPRSGWLMHPEQPKASAVAAQRVGDIITRGSEPHIYQALESDGTFESDEKLVWRPDSLMEGDAKTGDWQMQAPNVSAECETFGSNDTVSATGWSGGKLAGDGDYAWTLWRPYSCCEIKGVFIGSVDILPYP
jgi:integrating conjugative element protein (TIGR03756 family)